MPGADDDRVRARRRRCPVIGIRRLPGQRNRAKRVWHARAGASSPHVPVAQLIGGVWGADGDGGSWSCSIRRTDTRQPVPVADAGEVGGGQGRAGAPRPTGRRPPPADRAAALHRAADALEADADESRRGADRGDGQAARRRPRRGGGRGRHPAPVRRARPGAPRPYAWPATHDAIDLMAPEPRGVVAAITPWNDPVAVSCGLLGAALVTGNTVVLQAERAHPGHRLAARPAARRRTCPPACSRCSPATARWARRWPAPGGRRGRPRRLHRHRPGDRRRRAPRTGAKALLENGGSDPLIVDAGRRPGLGGGAGRARRLRQRRADLRGGGADLRAPGRGRRRSSTRWSSGPRRCGSGRAGPGDRARAAGRPAAPRRTCTRRSTAAVADGARVLRRRRGAGRAGRVLPGRPCWPTAPTTWR